MFHMWTCPDELVEIFSELPAPPLELSFDKDLNVDDLKYVSFEDNLSLKIDEAVQKWKELDGEYLTKKHKMERNVAGSVYLALPNGVNIWEMNDADIKGLIHPRIPASKEDEYYAKLKDIFSTIPRYKEADTISSHKPSLRSIMLKRDIDSTDFHVVNKRLRGIVGQVDVKAECVAGTAGDAKRTPQETARTERRKKKHARDADGPSSKFPLPNTSESVVTISIHSAYDIQPEELKQQEFEMLGSNTLADLRHAIYCVNGMTSASDTTGDSSLDKSSTDCSHTSSSDSFFFIEGKLYMDMKSTDALDYFAKNGSLRGYPLRPVEWLKTVKSGRVPRNIHQPGGPSRDNRTGIGSGARGVNSSTQRGRYFPPDNSSTTTPATVPSSRSLFDAVWAGSLEAYQTDIDILPMESIQFKSLQFRAGVRYLYAHMNQRCEHYMYISDVRVFHPLVDIHTYPRLMYMAKFERRKCEVCSLWSAQYITYGDRLCVNNPTHFCQHCYHMLHYEKDGALLYDDFLVFPYLHHMR